MATQNQLIQAAKNVDGKLWVLTFDPDSMGGNYISKYVGVGLLEAFHHIMRRLAEGRWVIITDCDNIIKLEQHELKLNKKLTYREAYPYAVNAEKMDLSDLQNYLDRPLR